MTIDADKSNKIHDQFREIASDNKSPIIRPLRCPVLTIAYSIITDIRKNTSSFDKLNLQNDQFSFQSINKSIIYTHIWAGGLIMVHYESGLGQKCEKMDLFHMLCCMYLNYNITKFV